MYSWTVNEQYLIKVQLGALCWRYCWWCLRAWCCRTYPRAWFRSNGIIFWWSLWILSQLIQCWLSFLSSHTVHTAYTFTKHVYLQWDNCMDRTHSSTTRRASWGVRWVVQNKLCIHYKSQVMMSWIFIDRLTFSLIFISPWFSPDADRFWKIR